MTLFSGPLTEVIQTVTQNGIRECYEARFMQILVRSDVTTFASLMCQTVGSPD